MERLAESVGRRVPFENEGVRPSMLCELSFVNFCESGLVSRLSLFDSTPGPTDFLGGRAAGFAEAGAGN